MNYLAPTKRRAVSAPHAKAATQGKLSLDSFRAAQARDLASLLHGLIENLLVVDEDATAELPLRQFRVCLTLFKQPSSMSEISRKMGVSLSAMTQTADRLERAGMVTRQFQSTDRRVRLLRLTERGQRLMRAHEEVRLRRIMGALERMSAKESETILAAFECLLNASRPTNGDVEVTSIVAAKPALKKPTLAANKPHRSPR